MERFDIAIIGGGPAGSSAANYLAEYGFNVCLIEKRAFPRDVICGEFLSYNVIEHLKRLNLHNTFLALNPVEINTFRLSTPKREIVSELGFAAYSIKRSLFDELLLMRAKEIKVNVYQPFEAILIKQIDNHFRIEITNGTDIKEINTNYVFAAYGKQNILDKYLNRTFYGKKTLLNGIKFYADKKNINNFNSNEISIYTANNVYCGVDQVNETELNFCVLARNNDVNAFDILYKQNKYFSSLLKVNVIEVFNHSKKYGTGNIYFGKRSLIENDMYMLGDAAGMIAPFAGDGIDMAMESGFISANVLKEKRDKNLSHFQAKELYKTRWENAFNNRIRNARIIQNIILNSKLNLLSSYLLLLYPQILNKIIKHTRN